MDINEALRRARLLLNPTYANDLPSSEQVTRLYDLGETLLVLMAPFVTPAEVGDDEMGELDAQLRERGPERTWYGD